MDDRYSPSTLLLAAAIVALGAAARGVAAQGELWFDEIWSWAIALDAGSFWAILVEARHDNNHVLNTWVLHALGPDRASFVYRLPPVLCGVGSIVLAGLVARRCRVESLLAMFLVGVSYFCTHYASEARGYAYAVVFALLAFHLVERSHALRSTAGALAFGVVAILGWLSQITFAYVHAALLAGSLARLRGATAADRMRLVRCHALPLAFGVAFYVFRVRGMKAGGGPGGSIGEGLLQALALTVGGPLAGAGAWLAAGLALAGALAAAVGVLRRAPADLAFHLGPLVLAVPTAWLAARHDFYPRLFLLASVFLLLLFARGLTRLLRRGRAGRIVVVVLLAGYLTGQALHLERLVRLGRSSYREAIGTMARSGASPWVSVGSRHDFRTSWILRFHADAAEGQPLYYLPRDVWPAAGPDWLILHDYAPAPREPTAYTDDGGNAYDPVASYGHAGLSGWNVYVYRNRRALLGSPAGPPPETFRVPLRARRSTSAGP